MITADKARKFLERGRMLTKDNTLNSLNVTEEQWTVALWMIKSNKKYSHLIGKTIQPGNAGKTQLSQRFSEVQSKWLNNRQHAARRVDELSCTQDNTTNPNAYKSPEDMPSHTHTHTPTTCMYTHKSWRGDVSDKTLVKMCFMANIALRLRWRCTSLATFLIKLMLRPFRPGLAWLRPNNVVNSFFAHFCVVRTSPGSHSLVLVANFVLSTNAIKGSWSWRLKICFNSALKRCMCN